MKARESEASAPPRAARIFGPATAFHRPHLHRRILVEA
jgi:hypothetical protein